MRWVSPEHLRVTHGEIREGRIVSRAMRAVALASRGDAASLVFTLHGIVFDPTPKLGVELRAANTSHLVYVMWRLIPKTRLTVQVKAPDASYLRVKPIHSELLDVPELGRAQKLAARIEGDRLSAWIENHLVWMGVLPPPARALVGFAGMRADHVAADVALAAD
ncbi:MAG TPA: hypothetical protein VFV99_25265 [Kofleriaceae bacterium]|nr:hypothetical protein [Kofleriaceae bacterium]